MRKLIMVTIVLGLLGLSGCAHTFHGIGEVFEGVGTDVKIMSNVDN